VRLSGEGGEVACTLSTALTGACRAAAADGVQLRHLSGSGFDDS
jgi:hypothetical protein